MDTARPHMDYEQIPVLRRFCKSRCTEGTDHRRHACATFRTQRCVRCHSTPSKHRRLQSALLVVRCILHNCNMLDVKGETNCQTAEVVG